MMFLYEQKPAIAAPKIEVTMHAKFLLDLSFWDYYAGYREDNEKAPHADLKLLKDKLREAISTDPHLYLEMDELGEMITKVKIVE